MIRFTFAPAQTRLVEDDLVTATALTQIRPIAIYVFIVVLDSHEHYMVCLVAAIIAVQSLNLVGLRFVLHSRSLLVQRSLAEQRQHSPLVRRRSSLLRVLMEEEQH